MKEYPNVIPFQFHNPSITATHSSAHLFNGVTDYLFNTYKMMWELSGETCRYGGEGEKKSSRRAALTFFALLHVYSRRVFQGMTSVFTN